MSIYSFVRTMDIKNFNKKKLQWPLNFCDVPYQMPLYQLITFYVSPTTDYPLMQWERSRQFTV